MGAVRDQEVVGTELERVATKIPVLFESDDMFFSNIKKSPVEVISNRLARLPLKMRPGGKFQYFNPNGGDLGRGGGPQWDKAVVQSVFMSENIEYTKLAQWSTDNNRKAVINAVRDLTAGALEEIRRQIDAQAMQNGTGAIGTVTTDTPAGGENVITCTTDGFGVRLMRAGQTVQIFDAALTTLRGAGEITFWDVENKTIRIFPQIANVAPTDRIVTDGISAPTSIPGLFGVPYHHSNASAGVWLGFDRALVPEVRASRVNANSNFLTLPLPRLAINKVGNRVGLKNNFNPRAWMHPAQKQSYEDIGQLVSIIQKQAKQEKLDMYFDDMQMAGAPVVEHFNWDMTRIDFVVDKVWGRVETLPIGFYNTDGRNIFEIRSASGGVTTADIFYMVVGMQLFVNNPAACSYIDTLLVPSGY